MLFDTYQLVHALSKAEKRYFQRSASLHTIGEKNNYLKLFDALNRQKKFDETGIQQAFRGQNLYLLKRHLYNSILRSTRAFHEASSTAIQVFSMISETEILYKKGLTKTALKLVHHAKKIASKNELHLAMAQLLELEIKLLSSSQQLAQAELRIRNAFEETSREIELYLNFQSCFSFRVNVGTFHNKEILFRDPEEQKKYSEEIKKLSLKKLSEKAKWELYSGAGTFFSAMGDHQKGYAYHKKAAVISEKTSSPVSNELRQYLLSLYTRGIADFYLKKYERALVNLKDLRTVFATLSDSENRKNVEELYLHSLLLEGFIRMDTHAYEKALPMISQLKKEVDEHRNINVSLRNDIYYQQVGYWFCTGDFREAQSWTVKMLQDQDGPKENPAHYRFARLMQLLTLLELGQYSQVESLLPATKKFLQRKGVRFKIEQALLEFISKYARNKELHSPAYRKEVFHELRKKLTRIAKDKNEAASLRIFDYIGWAKAKAENKNMAEAAK